MNAPRPWRDDGGTARVIKSMDDDGSAVEMIEGGEPEPALVACQGFRKVASHHCSDRALSVVHPAAADRGIGRPQRTSGRRDSAQA